MLLGTATNILECLWALCITFCDDNQIRLTGHHFTLRIRGTYLTVTPVTIVLAGVVQKTQKGLKALRQDGIKKLINTLTASTAETYSKQKRLLNDEI